MTFRDLVYDRARKRRARVVLAEGDDPRVVDAAKRLDAEGLADVLLLTDGEASRHPSRDAVVRRLLERNGDRLDGEDDARRRVSDSVWLAAGLVALGEVDAAVAGAVAPTADVVRAALWLVGTAPNVRTVSSSFYMIAPDGNRVITFTDAGVVPDPSPNELAEIALSAASARGRVVGDQAVIAFLSYSTKGSASGPRIDRVRSGLDEFRRIAPDVVADGELQGDAALVEAIARRKAPESSVAGAANVLVFPDLDSGNIAYKLVQHLGGWTALGPILQGLALPVCDLSRGATADDIVDVAVIAALLSGDGS